MIQLCFKSQTHFWMRTRPYVGSDWRLGSQRGTRSRVRRLAQVGRANERLCCELRRGLERRCRALLGQPLPAHPPEVCGVTAAAQTRDDERDDHHHPADQKVHWVTAARAECAQILFVALLSKSATEQRQGQKRQRSPPAKPFGTGHLQGSPSAGCRQSRSPPEVVSCS